MATLRQINANRQNSLKSTGPTSPEGKANSRANALKHGLAGEGIVLPDEQTEAIQERLAEWHSSLKPFDNVDLWLAELVATESVRIEACRKTEARRREEVARRAGESWEQDRELAAVKLSTQLARRPEVVARELATTTQGVDLLLERWHALGAVLEKNNDWTDPQRSLALDLLGVARNLREMDIPSPLDAARLRPGGLAALVQQRIEYLQNLKPTLDERDGREQADAMLGQSAPSPELNRLRRYEAACLRRLQWAYARLKSGPLPKRSHPYDQPLLPRSTSSYAESPPLIVAGQLADSLVFPSQENPTREPHHESFVNITAGSPTFPQATPRPQFTK